MVNKTDMSQPPPAHGGATQDLRTTSSCSPQSSICNHLPAPSPERRGSSQPLPLLATVHPHHPQLLGAFQIACTNPYEGSRQLLVSWLMRQLCCLRLP